MTSQLPPLDDRRPVLRPPQFRLWALFAGVAVLGGLFAIVHYFGSYGAAIGLLALLCVIGHFAGSALGTRLRACGDQPLHADGSALPVKRSIVKPDPADFAPTTKLRQRRSLGRRNLLITLAGAMVAGCGGYFGLQFLDPRMDWPVMGVGIAAFAVLGAIWTFATASFLQVMGSEFLQARRESGNP